ncbi:ATP-dependent helicase [bacterium]|nr:ATP-dependent helicase [bacterium]
MLINADVSTDKTDFLVNKYAELLNNKIDASSILVLVLNSNLKNKFIEKTLPLLNINSFEKLQVHSFNSLVFNTIVDNWAAIEQSNPFTNSKILPNLAGLEVSQFILKDIIKDVQFKGYNSKKSLLHQIFRRYSLIVQNNLSDKDVDERSKILKESFGDDVKTALKKFLSKTLQLRDLDYLRQILVFNYIYKNTGYFNKIKYLILDDGDEITPVCFDFVKHLAPQLEDVFVAFDKSGGSRCGYLSADRTAVWEFETLFNSKAIDFKQVEQNSDSEILFDNVMNDKREILKNFKYLSLSKRASMIDTAIKEINELLKHNVKPSQIAIVTPVIDDMLKFTLKENLYKGANVKFLCGSEKLIQNRLVLSAINILKLNTDLKSKLTEFSIRSILTGFLGIPLKYCREILINFDKNKTFVNADFPLEEYRIKYNEFLKVVSELQTGNEKLSSQVVKIFNRLADFALIKTDELVKFNFFIKQLQDFEDIFADEFDQRKSEILTQIENSIIAENPSTTIEINENDLVVGTMQKIIDNQINVKYQFWLDVSSSDWIKTDTGPLYNAWVFQKGWEKEDFTVEDNILLSKEKTAKILRKLTLLSKEKVYAFSSLFDGSGVENFGGIEEYLCVSNLDDGKKNETKSNIRPIIPRDDQKPVLEYKKGKMAISAVPGAGKTTILLALILKLLENGTPPENIFVMTYMESAARNFRERIKNIRPESSQLPNISTIHGLALRILKENGNFERLNLSSDFEICDDTQKTRIVKEAAAELGCKVRETEEFMGCLSVFKFARANFNGPIADKKILRFKDFYNSYQAKLAENNLIDYDDILISSVKLLEENPDILEYYQNICHYIIEDEAQDSSGIQQRLINLLSGKHKNLIRCGDINQAITTTFSNADVEGFRKFIKESNPVSMDCSQRCCEGVWSLANKLVDWAETRENYKNSFYNMMMKPVEGKNPVSENSVQARIFKTSNAERNYVLKEIKKALKQNPQATFGILLRANYQVASWQNFINDSGLKAITRSESLEQKIIFRVILAVLKLIQNPFDNENVAVQYETLSEAGLYKPRLASDIRSYENPFVTINSDYIENVYLDQFYWDLNYWLSFGHLSVDELAVKIGMYYFSGDIEKSNIYLIGTLIKRLTMTNSDFNYAITRLEELAKRKSLSGFKFFSEEDEADKKVLEGKIQIMTMHKSKGDEFDYVFIPELLEKSLNISFNGFELKGSSLPEQLRELKPDYSKKTEFQLKKEQISENLRLLYVAITRAKKYLYITTSTNVKSFGKVKEEEPNCIFNEILDNVEVIDD